MNKEKLQQYLRCKYPQENARCEWKEFKYLKNSFCGDEKNDVISYVSAIANMEGGYLAVGVHDKTMEIVGTDTYNYNRQKAILRLTERCTNLSSEGLDIEEFITDDTKKKLVWVIRIPQRYYRNYTLFQGMVNFNMIDTIGRGIRKVFTENSRSVSSRCLITKKTKPRKKLRSRYMASSSMSSIIAY